MILVRGLALGSALAASGIAAGELGWLTLGACMLVGAWCAVAWAVAAA